MDSETLGKEGEKSTVCEPGEGIGTGLAAKLCVGRDRKPTH